MRMEEMLRESEEKYRAIVENSPNFIGILQDGILKYVNRAATERLGWTYKELVSPSFDPIEKAVAERFRGLIKENVGKRLRGEDAPPYEVSLITRVGSEVPVIVRASKISYQGRPAVEFVFSDITESKQMDEVLRENEERFRKIFEEGPLGIALVRPDYRFARANKTFCTMLGYREEELTTLKFTDITHPEDIKLGVELTEKMLRGEMPRFSIEKRYIRKNGEILSAKLTASFIRDREGTAMYSVAMIEDVTEEKRAQEALRASEEKYRTLVENAADSIFMIDGKNRIVSANRSAARPFGKEPEEIQGKPIFDLFPKEIAAEYAERLNEVIKTGKGQISESKMVAGGKESWISTSLNPVMDLEGKVSSVLGVSRDITERKQSEEELRKSEERYRSLFQSMLEGFAYCKMILDDNGRPVDFVYLDVNSAFSLLTGLEGVVGKRVTEVIPGIKEENPELFEIYGRVALTGKPERFEVDLKSLGISLAISVSSPTKGNFVAVFENITDRKRMEERLRSLHEHALGLASARGMDEIVKYTLDTMQFTLGFDYADFSMVEDGLLVIKGSRGEIGSFSVKLGGPGIVAKATREMASIRVDDTRKEPNYFDRKGPDWKGPPTMLSELATPVVIGNQAVAVLTVDRTQPNAFSGQDQRLLENLAAHVASEMKRLEHERQLDDYSKHLEALVEERTKKLHQVESLAAIGETAAMVGHDLRNPLQGIAGASYNIRKSLRNTIDSSTKEMLAVIDSGVAYANGIINDLLDFSRETQLQRSPTTPRSIVRGALADVKVPSNIGIEDATADVPDISADESKLIRVLTNLIGNAIDAMPEGGKLSVSSLNLKDEVSISVTDTGVGVPQDHVEEIWRPLYTSKAKGIGLGLSICKRIVEAHGGSISVESIVGKGTTFTLKLPVGRVEGGEQS